ncbi:MAG: efflux RND transporter periplasmic adaptor subunit [Clostridiales Family XIII bacterium]|jgi:HlyD family secretion protein|nr:efflux RND transporter periplasmic adaptor subunit [Clostridiales Family XIII bacterium]
MASRAKKGSGKKKLAITLAAALVLAAGGAYLAKGFLFKEVSAQNYTEYTVARGDLRVSLSGSGSIQPNAQYDVVSMIGGDVIEDYFVEGDQVEKGDLLYVFDSSEIENTVERANLSLEKSQLSYGRTQESYEALTVTAPEDGRVAEIYVKEGDNVSNGGKVAKLIDDASFKARVPFSVPDAASLYLGQGVEVVIENTFEVLPGVITKIYDSSRVIDGYIDVTDVEVQVRNPGALTAGTYVSVRADGVACVEGGSLEGGAEKTVLAKASGLVEEVGVVVGEYVKSGALLASLSSDSAKNSLQDSQISLKEAQLSWASTEKQLSDYRVTAPISGSVISKSVKAGDTLENNTKSVMAVIADMSVMSFTINVDELDISKVSKGQQAQITVDALSGQSFTGTVDNVGILGSSSNGVTTYPVKIVFDDSEGLWPGMNATADIVVDSASDVLMIPVSAVSRGNMVLVKGAAEAGAASSPPSGSVSQSGGGTEGAGLGAGASGAAGDSVTQAGQNGGFRGEPPEGGWPNASPGAFAGGPPAGDRPNVSPGAMGDGSEDWGGRRGGGRLASGAAISPGAFGEMTEEERAARRAARFGAGGDGAPQGQGRPTGGADSAPTASAAGLGAPPTAADRVSSVSVSGSGAADAAGGTSTAGSAGQSPTTQAAGSGASSAARVGASMPQAPENSHYAYVELGLNNESYIEVKSGLSEGDVILIQVTSQNALTQNPMMMMGAPMGGGMGGNVVMRQPGQGGAPTGGQGAGQTGRTATRSN